MATLPVPALACGPGEEALKLLTEFRDKYEALDRAKRLMPMVPANSYKDLYEWAIQILANQSQQQMFGGSERAFLESPPSPRMEEALVPEEESETHLIRPTGPLRISLRKRPR